MGDFWEGLGGAEKVCGGLEFLQNIGARVMRREDGQAMVEFVLVFPVQLLFTLGIIQICLLFIGKQITEYAAFCAARAALVGEDAKKAAVLACSTVAFSRRSGGGGGPQLAGWGRLAGYGNAERKTQVYITTSSVGSLLGRGEVRASVRHDFELVIPVIGEVLANPYLNFLWITTPRSENWDVSRVGDRYGGAPHVSLWGYCALPKPWR
ncbi:MAG: hypothetical protein D6805_00685 [Planctomycetota bacterium]|nr:MAG: hypothetical protein D6805_00685 [Planctomycetota bacterium]